MATIIAVHGTYAHTWNSPENPPAELQWWETGSVYETEFREFVSGQDGPLNVEHFKWSGDNSELGRRTAGRALLRRMRELEAKKEPYIVVGHSHGGSVLAAALLASAARKNPLPHLKRWITIGTPFVQLRKELLLFTRLGLVNKVLFVASMMLLMMFLINFAASYLSGKPMLFGSRFPGVLAVTAGMMSLPALAFYLWFHVYDRMTLLNYRRRSVARAHEYFGRRWLSLAHADDEAIQGLSLLPKAKLVFLDRHFAVQAITFASVIAVPIIYFGLLMSPAAMVGVADWLNTKVYESRSSPEALHAVRELQERLREARDKSAGRRRDGVRDIARPAEGNSVWREYREARRKTEAEFPDLPSAERTLRFRQRFFEQDGKPCNTAGQLCGDGHDLRYNSGLLLHVVTDELSWSLGAADQGGWRNRSNWIWSLALPAILVPAIFGLLSLLLMGVIWFVATQISHLLSYVLNGITSAEVRRAAFGNDTEGEVAIGAIDRPLWIDRSPPRLPSALADLVTAYSNGMATRSVAKLRRALGQLAFTEPSQTTTSAITTYFTWKELVHAAYFDVPEFRKLVMQAASRVEGFAASPAFRSDPAYAQTAQWLTELETTPGTETPPATESPAKDAAAVSAVIASTVKAEP